MSRTLYIGANYHPHDSGPDRWEHDVDLMRRAGFNFVRMGHLAWDSYEPEDGRFTFDWFDRVMDLMHQAGIRVVLDIAVRPAPLWLHRKHPSIGIVDSSGNRLYPNHRYMEDIGDPSFLKHAVRFARTLVERYRAHPALLAFGIDNESGDGQISYSGSVRLRFIAWLREKHQTLDRLNRNWAGQRWSRRISDWDEIGLPVSGPIQGQPERILDFRRFLSDEIEGSLHALLDAVREAAPSVHTTTNAWFYSHLKYFDYSGIAYSGKMTREGCGFYPGPSLKDSSGIMNALFGISRIQYESDEPFWCNEFTTMTAVPGSIRKSAYATLLYGNQAVCGWTWQSMHGGEEQYLQGMIDWDGSPNRKYDEYRQIAGEFKKIAGWFPCKVRAETAIAFAFDSQISSRYFPESHEQQVQTCFEWFVRRNTGTRIVSLRHSPLKFRLLLIPGMTVMDGSTALKIRAFVSEGGTAVMTAYSAYADENGQVHSIRHPGHLDDLFGIRVSAFEETGVMNEISPRSFSGPNLSLDFQGKEIVCESARFELIEPGKAEVLGHITSLDREYPIVTSCKFGRGTAVYIGVPAKTVLLDAVLGKILQSLDIPKGPDVPEGVLARHIDEKHVLYLNISGSRKEIPIPGKARSLLFDRDYSAVCPLEPDEPEFLEWDPR